MASQPQLVGPNVAGSSSPPDDLSSIDSKGKVDETQANVPPTAPALATRDNDRMESVLGDAILRFLRLRKAPKKEEYDLDAVRSTLLTTLFS